jgi:hypothetical protein
MNVSRRGKIARLPRSIRDELNRRLRDGESGTKLLAWLNALPEMQCVMAHEFGGQPVTQQNLSDWRLGGYQEWLQEQKAAELVRHPFAEADELKSVLDEPASEKLGTWLAARYALASSQLSSEDGGELDWQRLRQMCSDVATLRQADYRAARLKMQQARSEFTHERERNRDAH